MKLRKEKPRQGRSDFGMTQEAFLISMSEGEASNLSGMLSM